MTTHIVEEAGTGLRVSLRTDDFHIAIDDFQFDFDCSESQRRE